MKYEEPILPLAIPASLVRRIGECIRADIDRNDRSPNRAESLRNMKNERALALIDAALIDHETRAIIGDSLSDANLKKAFSQKRKKTIRKKQND